MYEDEPQNNLFLTGVNTLADYFLNRKIMNDETAATSIEYKGDTTREHPLMTDDEFEHTREVLEE